MKSEGGAEVGGWAGAGAGEEVEVEKVFESGPMIIRSKLRGVCPQKDSILKEIENRWK